MVLFENAAPRTLKGVNEVLTDLLENNKFNPHALAGESVCTVLTVLAESDVESNWINVSQFIDEEYRPTY